MITRWTRPLAAVVIAGLRTVVSALIVGDVRAPSVALTRVYESHFVIAAEDGGALVRVGDFRDNQTAFQHYAKHVQGVDLGPADSARVVTPDLPKLSSFGEYRSAARSVMSGGADDGILEGIRPGGDLVRLDPKSGYFGARDPSGTNRTFFRPTGGPQQWLDSFNGQFAP